MLVARIAYQLNIGVVALPEIADVQHLVCAVHEADWAAFGGIAEQSDELACYAVVTRASAGQTMSSNSA